MKLEPFSTAEEAEAWLDDHWPAVKLAMDVAKTMPNVANVEDWLSPTDRPKIACFDDEDRIIGWLYIGDHLYKPEPAT